MTDKQLESIYEYMGWKEPYEEVTDCFKYTVVHYLDSNSAWEVVQEMYHQSDWEGFVNYCWVNDYVTCQNVMFIINPENFFNCFTKWISEKEKYV